MKVIAYLESSMWTMRGIEFNSMMRIAYDHRNEIDSLLDAPENPRPKPQSMLGRTGEHLSGTRYVQVRDGVAIIDVNGVIAKRMNFFQEICDGGTSTEMLMRDFAACVRNPNIESIVLHIDSPGGEAFGINEFAESVYAARGKKPIHAYVSGLGCSGAYWIASAADEIILDKSAFVGSIGVVTAWMDDKEFYKMLGIRREVVTSSNAPFKRLNFDNDEHREELQRELDSLEKVFHEAVSRNRGVTVEQVINDFNKGGVLAGSDAVDAGMAERVGSLEEVIAGLAKVKTIATYGATGERHMSVKSVLKEKISAFFASDEVKPLLEDGKEYAIIERPQSLASGGEEPEDPKTTPNNGAEGEDGDDTKPAGDEKPAGDDKPAASAASAMDAKALQLAETAAVAYVDSEVKAGRLFPAEKEAFKSHFVQAAMDDFNNPLASGTRVDQIKTSQAARKPHGYTEETVDAQSNEIFVMSLGDKAKTKLDREIDAQVDSYVKTVTPGTKLEAVK